MLPVRWLGALLGCAALALPLSARAEDAGRAALAAGLVALPQPPPEVASLGWHIGAETSYQLGNLGPLLSLDVSRFAGAAEGLPPTWFVALGAGLRGFLFRPRLPAVFVDLQGVVLGTTNPTSTQLPYRSSFLGVAAGGGIEWATGLSLALAGRYTYLPDGPSTVTVSLVGAIGAP